MKTTCYNKIYEIQYTIIHTKHDPMCSPLCLECKNSCGTYSDLMWLCPKICSFWLSVQNEIKKTFWLDRPINPHHFVLGLDSNYEHWFRCIIRIKFVLYAAHLITLQKWMKIFHVFNCIFAIGETHITCVKRYS